MIICKRKNYHGKYFLTLVFAMFVISFGVTHAAFADNGSTTTNGTKTIFSDNYSSSTGWTQIGSEVTVNSAQFPGVAYLNNAVGGGGVTEERVYKQLPSALPFRWTADFDYKFTSSSIPDHSVFALTSTSDDPEVQSPANRIVVNHGSGSDNLFILVNGGVDSTPIPISPNVQYYVRLDKTPTLLTLSVFSDPARTIQVTGSPSTFAISSTSYSNNLLYLQHDGCTICGSARTLTAQIDNTNIYYTTGNFTTPSPPQNLHATASNAQINLSWSAPSSNGGSSITNYKIYRGTLSGSETFLTTIGNVTSYNDTTVSGSQTYFYKVTAVNSIGESAQSNEASATPVTVPGVPSAPGSSMIFSDNYSSSAGWTQVGTEVYISNGHVVINGIDGSDHHIYKPLGTTLSNTTAFKLNFGFIFTAATNPADYIATLTDGTNSPDFVGNLLGAGLGLNGNTLGISYFNAQSMSSAQFSTSNIPLSLNTQYYVTLERLNSTTAKLSAFYDSARTVQVTGSPIYQTIPSRLAGLSVMEHAVAQTGCTCRSLTGYVSNTGLTTGSLVATSVSSSQINLSWTAPSSNGGSPVTNYKIYRSTSSGTETLLTEAGNATSYSDTAVTSGQTYFYKVTAVNAVGESPPSNEASATPKTAPSAPTGLAATTVSSSQINLSWSTPSSNGGSAITGYKIERSADGGTTWTVIVANNGCTCDGYLDHGLSPSKTYTYRVSAINSVGTSLPSNTASATTNSNAIPPPPTQTGTIFHDDYVSSTGWTQLGTEVTVDSSQFPNMAKFNNEAGGGSVTEERVYKQLPSRLPAYNWVLETTYEFTASSMPSAYPIALTIDSSNPESQPFPTPSQAIWIHHGTGSDVLKVGFVNSESSGVPISPSTPYYLKLERTPTMLILSVFSDSARTVQMPGSPVKLFADPTALQNLDFIQHAGSISSDPARTLTGQVTNTTIYVVHPSNAIITPSDDSFTQYTSPYNSQNFNGQGLIAKYHYSTYGGKDNRKAWLKFDLPVQPYQITNAVLRLYLTGAELPGSLVDVYRHNNNTWSESTITYNNEPAHFAALSAGPFAEQSLSTANQYYEWDVTNAITSNPNGQVVTLVLVGNSLNNGAGFADKESGISPQLVITKISANTTTVP